jgi:uncharacterized RDD family membrane protein YckC
LSTLPSSPATQPSWKQEVNRRLAEHKNRKGLSVVDQIAPAESSSTGNSRAAKAAARVAERYAKAPSYSEMQAVEARAALRAAEAATRAALEAQAVAQAALRNLEPSEDIEEPEERTDSSYTQESAEWQAWEQAKAELTVSEADPVMEIRWETDMPVRHAAEEAWFETQRGYRGVAADDYETSAAGQYFEQVEAAQPIHANLIEFPRELVATRRMRPRLTELNGGAEANNQLSIFEVDPSTISIDPAMPETASVPAAEWSGAEWSAIRLDEQPLEESEYRNETARPAAKLYQAPLGSRVMATLVDLALVMVVVCSIAGLVAMKLQNLPSMKASEVTGFLALLIVGALYEWLFLLYAKCTPGMRYAQISLCTFDDEHPTREQMKGRLIAMALSLLPMGLGMVWAIFDEDNMSWHDRYSQTYLRQS